MGLANSVENIGNCHDDQNSNSNLQSLIHSLQNNLNFRADKGSTQRFTIRFSADRNYYYNKTKNADY